MFIFKTLVGHQGKNTYFWPGKEDSNALTYLE
jgi:hypothetical protein